MLVPAALRQLFVAVPLCLIAVHNLEGLHALIASASLTKVLIFCEHSPSMSNVVLKRSLHYVNKCLRWMWPNVRLLQAFKRKLASRPKIFNVLV